MQNKHKRIVGLALAIMGGFTAAAHGAESPQQSLVDVCANVTTQGALDNCFYETTDRENALRLAVWAPHALIRTMSTEDYTEIMQARHETQACEARDSAWYALNREIAALYTPDDGAFQNRMAAPVTPRQQQMARDLFRETAGCYNEMAAVLENNRFPQIRDASRQYSRLADEASAVEQDFARRLQP